MYANKCGNFNEIDSMKDTNYQSSPKKKYFSLTPEPMLTLGRLLYKLKQGGWLPEELTMWLEG